MDPRKAAKSRKTNETNIRVNLNLDGTGEHRIATGIPFFDHMLTLFAKHAVMDLDVHCNGDLDIDAHHTVEDCGIALGQAILQALGDKKGIRRYGHAFAPETPESNAMTESPAIRSQKTKDAKVSSCEMISQMRTGRNEAGLI